MIFFHYDKTKEKAHKCIKADTKKEKKNLNFTRIQLFILDILSIKEILILFHAVSGRGGLLV